MLSSSPLEPGRDESKAEEQDKVMLTQFSNSGPSSSPRRHSVNAIPSLEGYLDDGSYSTLLLSITEHMDYGGKESTAIHLSFGPKRSVR